MALPKEPRQKMINIMYLVLTAILALNVSAEVINAFRVVNGSLENSNANIGTSTDILYKDLAGKLADPKTKEKASKWQPLAEKAHALSSDMDAYLNDLKLKLKQTADLRIKDGKEDFRADNLDASTRMFETGGKGKELKDRLDKYKQDMLSLDPEINKQFASNLPIETAPPPSTEGGEKKDFTQTYFHMTPTIAALTMLSKFQNNIKNSENQVVSFCQSQIGAVKVVYDQFAALVGQSSNYLMPGQDLEVTAGVGAFSKAAAPTITINGSNMPLDADGRAVFKTKVSGSGDKNVPVTVTYTKPDGSKESKSFNVQYTIGTPGGAAVMLDKMNVFYIGVDNPVTVSSGTGWDKTHVSMSGGTITPVGGAGKFKVRVSSPGTANITVNADGKPSTYPFRIKRIPDPVFAVGPSKGGRVQSVVFKNQQYCRADLENFDFEARFTVVSATVYFSGANFASVQTATIQGGNLSSISDKLSKCIPGTSVTFDNVKVQGPDGSVRTIQGPGYILF